MHLCGKGYKYFSPHCCKCNSFGCIAAIRSGNACHGPHSDSVYSGSEHHQFNSPRLVKREAGFPNPRRALIGSNQLWLTNQLWLKSTMTHHTTENWPWYLLNINICTLYMYILEILSIFKLVYKGCKCAVLLHPRMILIALFCNPFNGVIYVGNVLPHTSMQ